MDIRALYSRISPETQARQAGRERYAEAASKAANTKAWQRAADTALANLQGVSYAAQSQGGNTAALGRPILASPPPSAERERKGSEDRFTLLMASLINLLGDVSLESLKSRMEILRSAAKASAEGNKALSDDYLSALAELEAAVASASVSEEELAAAKAKVDSAQRALADAEAALGKTEPGTPEHAKALAARDLAQGNLTAAQQQLSNAELKYQAAVKVAGEAGKKAEALARSVEIAGLGDKPVLDGIKRQLNAAATMVLLMTRFAELMGESAENKIEAEQELFRSMQVARQEYMEKKSEEYLEQVRKAEAAIKTAGCIGKFLGPVLTVLSVVGAPFTGGASLILAAVGVGLTGADMLGKQLTGMSFMEKAMQPLMDNILSPMIQGIGKGIADLLKKAGVDAASADMAGMIMGAIIGAVAMVAVLVVVAVVGKSAAGRVANAMGNMFGKMANEMTPQMLKQAARAVSNGFTSVMTKARSSIGLKSDAISLDLYASRLAASLAVVEAGGTAAQSALETKSGIHQRNAAQHLADFEFAKVISEALKNYLHDMVQLFDQSMKAKDNAIKQAFSIQDSINSSSLSMARNI
ncbi:type III secretion system translocon subunit SctE [Pseudomonas monteilii]|uniref:type III secretion system translocon subunit SctE n=1 Tax=Pseudomonas TaxID=286 RepID=UPI0004843211|nr:MULTISPECIES: type III secretion system translocon subunit SctE [Pseudomonas]MBH3457151.1 type III secretion system translocon subunit SctE [Pseudomonas monteilii]PXX72344.1 invasin B [Pseudomonas sp. LAIL14HWK12:I1]SOC95382.1 invasin B [Pseudomonas sp. LAIL14HWK12:I3]